MKKTILSLTYILALLPFISSSQTTPLASDSLEINTLKIKVFADGGLWEMQTKDDSLYKTLMFAQNLWIGGYDGNSLHMAAQTYRQGRVDFQPGPISNDPNVYAKYNKVYRINLQTITDFANSNHTNIPPEIANWPANGDTTMGESYNLAPYVDVNLDGKYNPADGDYPKIKGDEAIFVIFNDKNGKTGGREMGVEIHEMIYAYQTGGVEDSIIYVDYQIFNRANTDYTNTYLASFTDFDLGNSRDDLIGTNISANSVFVYNADGDDEGPRGFGTKLATCGLRLIGGPPADYLDGIDNDRDGCVDGVRINGVCIPEDPSIGLREHMAMTGSMYFNSLGSSANQSSPDTTHDYYNYMKSLWRDNNNLILENPSGFLNTNNGDGYVTGNIGTSTRFAFPGNSIDTLGGNSPVNWFQSPLNSSDLRVLSNIGPFTLEAGEKFSMSLALVWSRSDTSTQGYGDINHRLNYLDSSYYHQPKRYVGWSAHRVSPAYNLFFQASSDMWFIQNNGNKDLSFDLYNTAGKLMSSLNVASQSRKALPTQSLPRGVYLLLDKSTGSLYKLLK